MQLRKYQDFESLVLMTDLLNRPENFYGDIDRYSLSVIFSAVYGIRLGELDHPIMIEFFDIWLQMLRRNDQCVNHSRAKANDGTDLQPGSLLVDFLPILERLPLHFQPGYKYAMRLRKREMRLHFAFYRALQQEIRNGKAPECFGSHLCEVSMP